MVDVAFNFNKSLHLIQFLSGTDGSFQFSVPSLDEWCNFFKLVVEILHIHPEVITETPPVTVL